MALTRTMEASMTRLKPALENLLSTGMSGIRGTNSVIAQKLMNRIAMLAQKMILPTVVDICSGVPQV